MSCCGQRRQAQRSAMTRQAPLDQASASLPELTPIGFRGDHAMVVRGPVTGTAYLFGPFGESLPVDARDARLLLRSEMFEAR